MATVVQQQSLWQRAVERATNTAIRLQHHRNVMGALEQMVNPVPEPEVEMSDDEREFLEWRSRAWY